jgi:hypothetical protein
MGKVTFRRTEETLFQHLKTLDSVSKPTRKTSANSFYCINVSVKLGRSTNSLPAPALRIANVGKVLLVVMETAMIAELVWNAMRVTSVRQEAFPPPLQLLLPS